MRLKHGHSASLGPATPEYQAWGNIIQRCYNPKNKADRGDRMSLALWIIKLVSLYACLCWAVEVLAETQRRKRA